MMDALSSYGLRKHAWAKELGFPAGGCFITMEPFHRLSNLGWARRFLGLS